MTFPILLSILWICALARAQDGERRPSGSVCLLTSQDVDARSYLRKARMIGGRAAHNNEFPWQVSIRRNGNHICGGSLIHEEWVLTAAHCLKQKDPARYLVEVGFVFEGDSHKQISETAWLASTAKVSPLQVEERIPAASFGRMGFRAHKGDIGLIKLTRGFRLDDSVATICLPDPSYRINGGGVIVSGWGVTREGGKRASPALRVVTVPYVSKGECLNDYSSFWSHLMGSKFDAETMFCAGLPEGGKDACQGDSGGPAVQFIDGIPTLVGIVSWGEGCARPGKPGVYTEAAVYVPWVMGTIRNYYFSRNQLANSIRLT
ncbi:trypsin-1-like [Galendromus occidentalis]|uniref:Trypsin-1-like n=1 Tax=Galendromus occidentalis TaxID=34638 RepID=A0AAJ7L653_9ACAR|nr:trypsin-1-like [Galendromus occidentalis]